MGCNTEMALELVKHFVPRNLRSIIGTALRNHRRRHDHDPHCFGLNFISEVQSRMAHWPIRIIFDVGANIGITALEFSDSFPGAAIYAFEPVRSNFKQMEQNLIGKSEIKRLPIGLGAKPEDVLIHVDPEHPRACSIMHELSDLRTETIRLDSIDHFCAQNKIDEVDLLKIDVEGYEPMVIEGAKKMLSEQRIAIIKAECSLDPDTDWHTPFPTLCDTLLPLGYRVFGFYDQYECWIKRLPALRHFDVAFVSKRASESRSNINGSSGDGRF